MHFENPLSDPVIHRFGNDEYVIPAECKFHLCDIASFIESTGDSFFKILICYIILIAIYIYLFMNITVYLIVYLAI